MEMQIWNNAVFDDRGSTARCDYNHRPSTWRSLRPLAAIPPAESLSAAAKENRNPRSPIEDVDSEIDKIEKEIERLQARLQELRLKKEKDSRVPAKRGRIVPSKFLDPKPTPGKIEIFDSPSGCRSRQRSLSLGPHEIRSGFSKQKPCFQKLQNIAEEAGKKEASPSKNEEINPERMKLRNSLKTVQPKKLFQETKKQFKKAAAAPPLPKEKSKNPSQKPPSVRTVSSRYSLITVKMGRSNAPEGKRRKWSLPGAIDKPHVSGMEEREHLMSNGDEQ